MSDYSSACQFVCAPGPNAAATLMRIADAPVFVVYLDPVNLTIKAPSTRDGARELAGFCRELAHEASSFARLLDPDGESPASPGAAPRHALVRKESVASVFSGGEDDER